MVLVSIIQISMSGFASPCTHAVRDLGGIGVNQVGACFYIQSETQLECIKLAKDWGGISVSQILACSGIRSESELQCV